MTVQNLHEQRIRQSRTKITERVVANWHTRTDIDDKESYHIIHIIKTNAIKVA